MDDANHTPTLNGALGITPPRPAVMPLIVDEIGMLRAAKLDPADYVAMVLPVAEVGMGVGQVPTPGGLLNCVFMQTTVVVPPTILPAEASLIVDPKTQQPQLSKRLRDAFPAGVVPILRAVVKRSSLHPEMQKQIEAAVSSGHSAANPTGDA